MDKGDGDNEHAQQPQVPRWVTHERLWERFMAAPTLVQLCVAQLLDRGTIEHIAALNLDPMRKLDVVMKVDCGHPVMRPDVVVHG